MLPIVTDRVPWSVGLCVTQVSPANTAALIEMPFGLLARIGRKNHVLDGVKRYWETLPWQPFLAFCI